jgi:rubredoxin
MDTQVQEETMAELNEEVRREIEVPYYGQVTRYTLKAVTKNPGQYDVTAWSDGGMGRGYEIPAISVEAAMDGLEAYMRAEEVERMGEVTAKVQEREEKDARRAEALARIERGEYDPSEIVVAFQCPECEHIFDEGPEEDPRYDCQNCGNEFSRSESEYESHRCGQCGKFASKMADTTCPECQSGIDSFEHISAVEVDGELVEVGVKEPA